MTNYFDKQGNYINCENLSLAEIYHRAFALGVESVAIDERPQGKYVDISKLRLMKVEECAGHTIDYAMGWKACIEWIKKGGAE